MKQKFAVTHSVWWADPGIIGATVSITSIVFAALGLHQARLCKHCEKGENFR